MSGALGEDAAIESFIEVIRPPPVTNRSESFPQRISYRCKACAFQMEQKFVMRRHVRSEHLRNPESANPPTEFHQLGKYSVPSISSPARAGAKSESSSTPLTPEECRLVDAKIKPEITTKPTMPGYPQQKETVYSCRLCSVSDYQRCSDQDEVRLHVRRNHAETAKKSTNITRKDVNISESHPRWLAVKKRVNLQNTDGNESDASDSPQKGSPSKPAHKKHKLDRSAKTLAPSSSTSRASQKQSAGNTKSPNRSRPPQKIAVQSSESSKRSRLDKILSSDDEPSTSSVGRRTLSSVKQSGESEKRSAGDNTFRHKFNSDSMAGASTSKSKSSAAEPLVASSSLPNDVTSNVDDGFHHSRLQLILGVQDKFLCRKCWYGPASKADLMRHFTQDCGAGARIAADTTAGPSNTPQSSNTVISLKNSSPVGSSRRLRRSAQSPITVAMMKFEEQSLEDEEFVCSIPGYVFPNDLKEEMKKMSTLTGLPVRRLCDEFTPQLMRECEEQATIMLTWLRTKKNRNPRTNTDRPA